MFPPFPPIQMIVIVVLIESLFGLAYNRLFEWAKLPNAYAVIGGCMATIGIAVAFWWRLELAGWQWSLLMLACFSGSGLPMVGGFMARNRKSHKRTRITGTAARIRDEAMMDMEAMATDIARQAKEKSLTTANLPDYVNRLHQIAGMLKGM